ncbi:MAG: glycosyltransferase [Actinocatenispora sp.]
MTVLPSVSVVICCYTEARWDDVTAAVKSLGEQTVTPAEVLLIVDHNPALSRRARDGLDGVRVADNNRRPGLSGARNTGVALATGEVVAFLDDDARADPAWLERMLVCYQDPDVAAVGGHAIPRWPDDSRPPAHLPPELYWVIGCGYRGQPTELSPVRNLMGCAMSFRRAHLDGLGGFAEHVGRTATLPLGCEETELCIRLRQRVPTARTLLEPAATVHHRVTPDRMTWRYLRRRSWAEGLSKAAVAKLVGQQDALSTESSYLRSVLTRAVGRSLREAVSGHPRGLAAAAGIVLATGAAGLGYLVGRFRQPTPAPAPAEVYTVDIGEPWRPPAGDEALVLVRDDRCTLGAVQVCAGTDDDANAAAVRELATTADEQRAAMPAEPAVWPRISVVLATCGRPALAERCIGSVLDTGYPDLEIMLVDNTPGEPDRQLAALAGRDPRVRYLHEPTPGASLARNRGAEAATGDLLAFTDDDAVVDRHWLTAAAAELASADVDCVTGLVLPLSLDSAAQRYFEAFGGFGKGYQRRTFAPDSPAPDPLYPLAPGIFGSGNNMVWRRSAYDALHGFDTRLGPGRRTRAGEDLDLFVRLVSSGGRLTYTPHSLVWHEHRTEVAALRGQLRGYGTGLGCTFLLHALRPGGARQILRRLPRGLHRLLANDSDRNAARGDGFPRRLVLSELGGLVAAPGSLAVELWRARRAR